MSDRVLGVSRRLAVLVVLGGAALPGCDGCAGPPDAEADASDTGPDGQVDAAPDARWEDLYCVGCEDNDDQDSDGDKDQTCGTDCDDLDPNRRQGNVDVAGDGYDADCSGVDGQDWDRDGFFAAAQGGDDCDDEDATVHPGAPDNEGWVLADEPFSGNLGSIAIVASGVAVVTGGPGPGCPYDGDGDGVAETVLSPGATEVDVAFRWAGGWWTLDPEPVCATSRIDVATTRLLAHVLFGAVEEDGEGWIGRLGTSPGFPRIFPTSAPARSPHAEPSIALQDCNVEAVLFVSEDDRTLVRYPIFSGGRVGLVDSSPSRAGDLEYSELAVPSAVYILPDGAGRESVRFARSPPGRMHEWAAQTIWGPAPDGEILDVALAISPEGGPGGQPHVALLEVGGVHLLDPSTTPAGDLVVDPGPVDGVGDPSVTIAIALDATGATHLAWVAPAPGPAHGEIRYATDASGTWEVQIVGSGDGWADLALDHRGNPHMSWHTEQRGAEKAPHPGTYATFAPIDGVDENCDGVDGVDADGDGSPGSHK